jgi:hypothetical protein
MTAVSQLEIIPSIDESMADAGTITVHCNPPLPHLFIFIYDFCHSFIFNVKMSKNNSSAFLHDLKQIKWTWTWTLTQLQPRLPH